MALDGNDLRRRARGSLLGVAIGDAMGAACEGMSAAAIREKYGVITGFLSDDAVGTDDTDFTLFNAHILLTYGPSVTLEQVEAEWRDKLLSGRYYYRPGGFSDVISTRNLQAGLHAPSSGQFNHQMWSDGVAMAISPAGILAAGDPALAVRLAERLGGVSNGRDGLYAAGAVAAAVAVAMQGATPDEMCRAGLQATPADCWTHRALDRALALDLSGRDLDSALEAIEAALVLPWWPWADLVTEAAPVAFAVFRACQGVFERAVPAGVRLGRDADTIGAIVGSLAGAYGGAEAIPPDWQRRVSASTGKCIGFVGGIPITDIADRLADMAAGTDQSAEERAS
ncbi:MAG: ADP-ribosylglycohydrolase family protein [Anaerolineae bacterium]|nr:ADP-ribosylglycohydrolase family protein [Anaerolineae bacterium]